MLCLSVCFPCLVFNEHICSPVNVFCPLHVLTLLSLCFVRLLILSPSVELSLKSVYITSCFILITSHLVCIMFSVASRCLVSQLLFTCVHTALVSLCVNNLSSCLLCCVVPSCFASRVFCEFHGHPVVFQLFAPSFLLFLILII